IEKGFTPPRPLSAVPRVFGYHKRLLPLPLSMRVASSRTGQLACEWPFEQLTGPFHIRSIAEASVGVRQVASLAVHVLVVSDGSDAALYSQARGSVSTPSTTPSSASQAATALLVASASFALRVAPTPP